MSIWKDILGITIALLIILSFVVIIHFGPLWIQMILLKLKMWGERPAKYGDVWWRIRQWRIKRKDSGKKFY